MNNLISHQLSKHANEDSQTTNEYSTVTAWLSDLTSFKMLKDAFNHGICDDQDPATYQYLVFTSKLLMAATQDLFSGICWVTMHPLLSIWYFMMATVAWALFDLTIGRITGLSPAILQTKKIYHQVKVATMGEEAADKIWFVNLAGAAYSFFNGDT